ncbi:hypothetical protein PTTG_11664 [Puccinia triticina 1-1 BBBD Race 1]|uniref:Uncharacterized protein n=2 Tax=Puccinia triticina TaxID=208348 RepID=A0A180H0Z0_PUCT1|nr:uncharacterized protein PtA15_10A506 [Puccinia triticina]OAV98003.1 hypothetical protein PTTG_11664 [Puccinia triticina 1-1 BBBD Race 1]WAQ89083.1 hypothetical protein PtA15_10A506 [Puccinia triticina]WAR59143.1 hypothetical protein PtB15_10B485 [Puccinia triticina]
MPSNPPSTSSDTESISSYGKDRTVFDEEESYMTDVDLPEIKQLASQTIGPNFACATTCRSLSISTGYYSILNTRTPGQAHLTCCTLQKGLISDMGLVAISLKTITVLMYIRNADGKIAPLSSQSSLFSFGRLWSGRCGETQNIIDITIRSLHLT